MSPVVGTGQKPAQGRCAANNQLSLSSSGGAPLIIFEVPPASQRFVELDYHEAFAGLDVGEDVLRGEKLLLGFEDFVVAYLARIVAVSGHLHGLAVGFDGFNLFGAGFLELLARDKSIGDFAKCVQGRLLVIEPCLFGGGLSLAIAGFEAASLEDRSGCGGRQRPGIRAAGG